MREFLSEILAPLYRIGSNGGPTIRSGAGSPEGVVTAPVGSEYHRTDGGSGTTLYIKESGSGNTGWVALAPGGGGGGGDPGSTPTRVYYFNDFFAGNGDNFGSVNQSGTGGQGQVVGWPWSGSPVGAGFMRFAAAAVSSRAVWWSSQGSVQLYRGQGAIRYRVRGGLITLSNSTDRYIQTMGIVNAHSSEPSQGYYFRYSDDLSGGNWEAVTAKSGSTITDTGVAADANGNHIFEIQIDAAGTTAEFYIDGTLVATHTTNIPATDDSLGILCGVRKTVGTGAVNASAWDYICLDMQFPSRT